MLDSRSVTVLPAFDIISVDVVCTTFVAPIVELPTVVYESTCIVVASNVDDSVDKVDKKFEDDVRSSTTDVADSLVDTILEVTIFDVESTVDVSSSVEDSIDVGITVLDSTVVTDGVC